MNSDINALRKNATRRFLTRYAIRRTLETVDGAEPVVDGDGEASLGRQDLSGLVRPYDREIREGVIRLLAQAERPTYVLVAKELGKGLWLTVPFSGYADPATDGEMSVIASGGTGLDVLQLWNAKILLSSTLAKGWKVATAPEDVLADTMKAWRATVGLGGWSDDQRGRLGAKNSDSPDTIASYLDEERRNLAAIVETDRKYLLWRKAVPVAAVPKINLCGTCSESRLAAGDQTAPDVRRVECAVEGMMEIVSLAYDVAKGQVSLRVFDANGNDSTTLDGWFLVDGNGEALSEIVQGKALAANVGESLGGCCLVTADGTVHGLVEQVEDWR